MENPNETHEPLTESQMEYVAALCENASEIAFAVREMMRQNGCVIAEGEDTGHEIHHVIREAAIELEARLPDECDHDYYDHIGNAAEMVVIQLMLDKVLVPGNFSRDSETPPEESSTLAHVEEIVTLRKKLEVAEERIAEIQKIKDNLTGKLSIHRRAVELALEMLIDIALKDTEEVTRLSGQLADSGSNGAPPEVTDV